MSSTCLQRSVSCVICTSCTHCIPAVLTCAVPRGISGTESEPARKLSVRRQAIVGLFFSSITPAVSCHARSLASRRVGVTSRAAGGVRLPGDLSNVSVAVAPFSGAATSSLFFSSPAGLASCRGGGCWPAARSRRPTLPSHPEPSRTIQRRVGGARGATTCSHSSNDGGDHSFDSRFGSLRHRLPPMVPLSGFLASTEWWKKSKTGEKMFEGYRGAF